ncbi:hypothetical protein NPIL_427751 [Nephila pilipes]|uniref:Uncharacterized protein n=1 Tax=Nephila pilipes TaxID=299642 RepID=A0A8X6TYK9_NEPPI|nr:hypothetical protein NPIL_427751 [Nephila pilipes]
MEINRVDRLCLKDHPGVSVHVVGSKKMILLGEYVWLKSLLDYVCHCLVLAKIKIKTKRGEFYTKAAIKPDGRSDDSYLLDNRTAEIKSREQGTPLINVVVARSTGKTLPF